MTLCDIHSCTGCSTCALSCPQGCISMRETSEGFLYPVIDTKKCLNCGICANKCPVKNEWLGHSTLPEPRAYAAKAADRTILAKSTSGGIFTILAKWVVEAGGAVYGAAFAADLNVKHTRADSLSEVLTMQGSKYVESSLMGIFPAVKQDLLSNRKVLFSGTPCQVAGLNAYLGTQSENLITVDVLCHGVPSCKLWNSYLAYLRELRKSDISDYRFRDKAKWGWGSWGSYEYTRGGKRRKHYFTVAADYFYSLYFLDSCFRESCYTCKFATLPRQGDITLGDYWGITDAHPEFDVRSGVSVVFANTGEGLRMIEQIADSLVLIDSSPEKAMKSNKTFISPATRPDARTGFYERFVFTDFKASAKQYCNLKPMRSTLARYLPSAMKRRFKMLIKRMRG